MEKIKITQIKSAIGLKKKQKVILKTLGLGKINKSRELPKTPIIYGMVKKVHHILKTEKI